MTVCSVNIQSFCGLTSTLKVNLQSKSVTLVITDRFCALIKSKISLLSPCFLLTNLSSMLVQVYIRRGIFSTNYVNVLLALSILLLSFPFSMQF